MFKNLLLYIHKISRKNYKSVIPTTYIDSSTVNYPYRMNHPHQFYTFNEKTCLFHKIKKHAYLQKSLFEETFLVIRFLSFVSNFKVWELCDRLNSVKTDSECEKGRREEKEKEKETKRAGKVCLFVGLVA